MPQYPPMDILPPQLWTDQHLAAAEQSMRDLAVVDHILKRCEACKIGVGQMRADCDGLCEFFTNWITEYKNPQSGTPSPLV